MNNQFNRMQKLAGVLNESNEGTTHASSGFIYGDYKASTILQQKFEDVQKDHPELKFYVEFDNSHIRRDKDIIKYSYSFPLDSDNESLKSILKDTIEHFKSSDQQNESTIVDKNTDSSKAASIAAREETSVDTVNKAIEQAKSSGKPVNINETSKNTMKKSEFKKYLKEEITAALKPTSEINEMAAIKGDIKNIIDKLIADNPDMEAGPLARLIMKNPEINAIIDRDNLSDMAQNQTQKYIKLVRGERELGQRGRKAGETKTDTSKSGPSEEDMISFLQSVDMVGDDAKWQSKLKVLSPKAIKDLYGKYSSQLNEMAKITGELETAINNVIDNNPDLEGLALKKAIKADLDVNAALAGDSLHDNQLNRFIGKAKGTLELGQRGRKLGSKNSEKTPSGPSKEEMIDDLKKKSFSKEDQKYKPALAMLDISHIKNFWDKYCGPEEEETSPSLQEMINDDDYEINDTWNKEEDDFADDFTGDEDNEFEPEDVSLDSEMEEDMKRSFWRTFTNRMKDEGLVGENGAVIDREAYMAARQKAQSDLDTKLKK